MKKIRLTEAQCAMLAERQNIDEGFKDSLKKGIAGAALGAATLGGMHSCAVTDGPNSADNSNPDIDQKIELANQLGLSDREIDEFVNDETCSYEDMKRWFTAHPPMNESRRRNLDAIINESINSFLKRRS